MQDVRQSLPEMLKASTKVEQAVNSEIQRRIREFYPKGKKLRFQSPGPWKPNTVRAPRYKTCQILNLKNCADSVLPTIGVRELL